MSNETPAEVLAEMRATNAALESEIYDWADRLERALAAGKVAYTVSCVHFTTQEGTCFFEVKTDDPPENGAVLYTAPPADPAKACEHELVSRAMEYLRPHLESGTFSAPDWAIQMASILTGGNGCGKPIKPAKASEPDLHPKTADLVNRFARALAEKLAAAEVKYGYSDGWASPDWMDECRQHLLDHVHKGDPRDVAAYCAFLWHHGEHTSPNPWCEVCGGDCEGANPRPINCPAYAAPKAAKASGSAPDVSDEAIERALDAKIGLDNTLRQLIRGDTMAVGYSKVDVVRALLAELGSTATPPASAPEVTVEMIERACTAAYPRWGAMSLHDKDRCRESMRAALTAALQQEGKSHG